MMSNIYSICSYTVVNGEPIWCWRFQSSHPIVFPVFRISAFSFVDERYCNILKETIITIKMFIQMFLYTSFPSPKLSVIRFILITSEPKLICGFSSILFLACFTCKQINQGFVITIQPMVNFKRFRGYTISNSI